MMLVAFLLSASAATPTDQTRVDALVTKCDADKVVQLLAQGQNDIAILMKITDRAPTVAENVKFSCVLSGMRKMDDLAFGFIGNEASPPN